MALARPDAVLTVAGQTLTAAEAGLRRLEVQLSVRGAHDLAVLSLWPGSKLAGVAVDDPASIELGLQGATEPVITGHVAEVRQGPAEVEIEVLAKTAPLSRTWVVRTYLDSTVGDIVRDLAGEVAVDAVDGDLKLAAFSVDDRRPVWAWLRTLAAHAGTEVGASPEGGLRFVRPPAGSPAIRLRRGADLLAWSLGPAVAPAAPAVVAHGSASEQGTSRWHWLARDPAGGAPARVVGAFHSKEAADQLAEVLKQRAARSRMQGRVRTPGRSDLRPGALVGIEGVDGVDVVRALELTHVLDSQAGFVTELWIEGAS